jgi:hypothetical protein
MSLVEDCVKADNAVKKLEDQLKEAKSYREGIRAILFDELVGSGTEAIEVLVDDVVCRVAPKVELMASIPEGEVDSFTKYCDSVIVQEAREATKLTPASPAITLYPILASIEFNAKRLSTYVKKEFLGNRPVPVVSVFFKSGISITRKQRKEPKE